MMQRADESNTYTLGLPEVNQIVATLHWHYLCPPTATSGEPSIAIYNRWKQFSYAEHALAMNPKVPSSASSSTAIFDKVAKIDPEKFAPALANLDYYATWHQTLTNKCKGTHPVLYDMVRDPEGYSPSTADEKVVADAFESKLFSYLTTNIKDSRAHGILLPYTRSLYAQYGKALEFLVELYRYVLKSPHYQQSLLVKL